MQSTEERVLHVNNQSVQRKIMQMLHCCELTFASLSFEQAVSDELGAVGLQGFGHVQSVAVQSVSIRLLLAAQL